ncbi:MAG: MFS transporter, partial [Actinomycetota bacterium]
KNRPVIRACVAVLLMSGLFFAAVFYFPQFFQKILGEDTLVAGMMLLPFVVVFAATSFVEPWLVGKIGTKAVLSAGAAALFLGALLTVLIVDDNAEWAAFVPGMMALGIGVGLFYSAITNAALDLLPPEKSSLAGGLLYMFQIAGGAVGLALTTTVFLATSSREIDNAATDIGVQLSTGERNDIQGVLAGTDTSQELLDQYSSQASQLTEIVRDSFITGMRWGFGFNALLSLAGLLVVVWAVGGPPSMLFRDRDADAGDDAEHDAEEAAADEAGAL